MAFNTLPIELNKEIATYLEADSDLCNYRLTCRATHDGIDGDFGSYWRSRYNDRYDPLHGCHQSSAKLKKHYQSRQRLLKKDTTTFSTGITKPEKWCLLTLKDMLLETFTGRVDKTEPRATCHNLARLKEFARRSNLIDGMFDPKFEIREPSLLLQAVQLMLSHLSLNFRWNVHLNHAWMFAESQKMVYADVSKEPLFTGKSCDIVNINWFRHALNFFKHYFIEEKNGPLRKYMEDLSDSELPGAWDQKIVEGTTELESHWKGTYSYAELADIIAIRETRRGRRGDDENEDAGFSDGHIADEGRDMNPIQTLMISHPNEESFWPPLFERVLKAKPQVKTTRTPQRRSDQPRDKPDSKYFEGEGIDDEGFYTSGYLNPLPPQQQIPGWQRMTMMKFYLTDNQKLDTGALWAYEGVVLPGGSLILGRWWSPTTVLEDGSQYSGPFILWNVKSPDFERADSVLSA